MEEDSPWLTKRYIFDSSVRFCSFGKDINRYQYHFKQSVLVKFSYTGHFKKLVEFGI